MYFMVSFTDKNAKLQLVNSCQNLPYNYCLFLSQYRYVLLFRIFEKGKKKFPKITGSFLIKALFLRLKVRRGDFHQNAKFNAEFAPYLKIIALDGKLEH